MAQKKKITHTVEVTKKECELVRSLADGQKQTEIMERLQVNYFSLGTTLKVLRDKFGCKTSAHLVAYFLRHKWID
jgi:DNA-binding CsgD family transcriptional regulator